MNRISDIFLAVWQLPQTLLGALLVLYCRAFGGVTVVARRNSAVAFSARKMREAVSLGQIVVLSEEDAKSAEAVAHELDGHTADSKRFGPLYLLVIGIPSLLNATFHFTDNYFDWFTERRANRFAGLECDSRGRLRFKDLHRTSCPLPEPNHGRSRRAGN